jgi:methylthioribose-1-phosphate isomerase
VKSSVPNQRRLPLEEVYLRCQTWEEVADAICTMATSIAPFEITRAARSLTALASGRLSDRNLVTLAVPDKALVVVEQEVREDSDVL